MSASGQTEVRVRREAWALARTATWDPHTLAYARAVLALQERAFPEDQTGWEYQAAMHGTDETDGGGPHGVWNMCQHESWFFLPWHRMYILWFERIVQSVVAEQGGPADWALPYWDWQTNGILPPAFRQETLPAVDGAEPERNPLLVQRSPGLNDGTAGITADASSSSEADGTVPFFGDRHPFGFGGGVIDAPSHFGAGSTGRLERQPHNLIHRAVGGVMATAASPRDPIFWLHHAQVDRLWGRWLRLGGGRMDPVDDRWLDEGFDFFDPGRRRATMTPREVVSTERLGYRYQDDPPPSTIPITAVAPRRAAHALLRIHEEVAVTEEPQELGVSGPLTLGDETADTTVELTHPDARNLEFIESPDVAPSVAVLVLDGLRPAGPDAASYEVYLNVDTPGDRATPHFVGFLEFFGVDHAHAGHTGHERGVGRRVFDITSAVQQLTERGQWDPARVRVTFLPARLLEDTATGSLLPPQTGASVEVGAVRILAE